jgi:hypothetical protein
MTSRKRKTPVNINRVAAILSVSLLVAGSPALASAADMQSGPIHINQVYLSGGYSADADGDEATYLPGAANVSFTNESATTATDVVFALETHGYVFNRFNDVGSFAPGVAIHHRIPETELTDDIRVAVARATFVDGTVWQNPDVPAPLEVNTNVGVAASRN